MQITDLFYLTERELNVVLSKSLACDILNIALVLPDDVLDKILPCCGNDVRMQLLNQRKQSRPVPLEIIQSSEEKIISEMRKLFE